MDTVNDPDFKADAKKSKLDVEPMSWQKPSRDFSS